MVLKNCGPRGYPGMAEIEYMPIPAKLLRRAEQWSFLSFPTRPRSDRWPSAGRSRISRDIADWDLKAKAHSVPLYRALGGSRDRAPIYVYDTESGWLHISSRKLSIMRSVSLLADFAQLSSKSGTRTLPPMSVVCEAVCSAIPQEIKLLLDANQGWTPGEGIGRARVFEPLALIWLEEPIAATDVQGHRQLQQYTSILIAVGETLYSKEAFSEYTKAETAGIFQPDVARVAGITGWMKIEAMLSR
jgi:L-alanine-DL-glutamate epimerase-like enolase superfamily enzyme